MDCYKILRVNEDASDEEIYKSYIALKSNYSREYNTSPYAKRKYREIEKAYSIIKNELNRNLYFERKVEKEKVKDVEELFDYDAYNTESIKDVFIPLKLESVDQYKDVEVTKKIEEKEKVITYDVDYVYYVLGIKYSLKYLKKVKCNHSVTSNVDCDVCNCIGKVSYGVDVILCPTCNKGVRKVHKCDYCNDVGYILKDEYEEIFIDEEIISDGIVKDGIRYSFNLINKDKVKEEKNNVYIEYDLSYEETINGIDLKWNTQYGDIVIKEDSNKINKEYIFNGDKKIHLIINKVAYKGRDINKYLFIKPTDLNKKIYLDCSTLLYSEIRISNYNKEIIVSDNSPIVLDGYGETGINNGNNGDLILTPIITSSKIKGENYDEYKIEIIDTSKFTNMFGGRINKKIFILGFKGAMSVKIDDEDKKIYILTGKGIYKRRISSYFVLSMFIYLLWVLMPLLLFILPYTKVDLIVSCVMTIVYSIVANIVLNLKL